MRDPTAPPGGKTPAELRYAVRDPTAGVMALAKKRKAHAARWGVANAKTIPDMIGGTVRPNAGARSGRRSGRCLFAEGTKGKTPEASGVTVRPNAGARSGRRSGR